MQVQLVYYGYNKHFLTEVCLDDVILVTQKHLVNLVAVRYNDQVILAEYAGIRIEKKPHHWVQSGDDYEEVVKQGHKRICLEVLKYHVITNELFVYWQNNEL